MRSRRTADGDSRRHTSAALTSLLAIVVLTGCGEGDPAPGPEVAGGVAAVDTPVNEDVNLVDVELEYPLDGVYDVGEDASLYVAITNTGPTPVTLEDVTGPDFGDARGSTGTGDVSITVGPNDSVYIGAKNEPSITLVDLRKQLRSSQSIPVTFEFESAGSVTVRAVVAAEGQDPSPTYDFPDPDEDPSS
jgi:hypothetical protein